MIGKMIGKMPLATGLILMGMKAGGGKFLRGNEKQKKAALYQRAALKPALARQSAASCAI
jgi:hypothetical protein